MNGIWEITDQLSQGSDWVLQGEPDLLAEKVKDFDIILIGCYEKNVARPGPGVFYLPFDDDPAGIDEGKWDALFKLTHGGLPKGAKVLTVCSMGENRSGLLSALVYHAKYGGEGRDIVEIIRSKAKPNTSQPYVLWNPGFYRQVCDRLH